jgi:hypothetical protein
LALAKNQGPIGKSPPHPRNQSLVGETMKGEKKKGENVKEKLRKMKETRQLEVKG